MRLLTGALLLTCLTSMGASFRSPNFIVTAADAQTAKEVAMVAEESRSLIAIEWLGEELPGNWDKPCKVSVEVNPRKGASGETTFKFGRNGQGETHVYGWDMHVRGSKERILDSVVPHEVSHTILASYFRRPLPRWADEGASTLVEHKSEKMMQVKLLNDVIGTSEQIPLKKLLEIKEYPRNPRHVLTLYAEGFGLTEFLVEAGGKKRFLKFLQVAHQSDNWQTAIQKVYSLNNIDDLEKRWKGWVLAGRPELPKGSENIMVAGTNTNAAPNGMVVRSQSPEQKPIRQTADASEASGNELKAANPRTRQYPHPRDDKPAQTSSAKPERVSRPQPRLLRVLR